MSASGRVSVSRNGATCISEELKWVAVCTENLIRFDLMPSRCTPWGYSCFRGDAKCREQGAVSKVP